MDKKNTFLSEQQFHLTHLFLQHVCETISRCYLLRTSVPSPDLSLQAAEVTKINKYEAALDLLDPQRRGEFRWVRGPPTLK